MDAPDTIALLDESGTRASARFVVAILDGSPDGDRAAETLRRVAAHSVLPGGHVYRAPASADFVGGLRAACEAFPGEDVVVLAAGIDVPYAWDARLVKTAYAARRIAAVSPMCDAAPAFSVVGESEAALATDCDLVDRTAFCLGDRSYYEVPALLGACAYLRRDALDHVLGEADRAPGGSAEDLAARFRALGWSCVLSDHLYAGSSRLARTASVAAEDFDVRAFRIHHPLGALRRALNDALRSGGLPPVSTPGLDARPVHLHVMHFWGGGLDRWVRDFGRADTSATSMLFASYRIGESGGQRLVLYAEPDARIPIRTWDIARPIRSTVPESLEYRRVLDQIIAEFDVDAIIVSSLIGHSLDALTRPVRTVVVCHDFYPVCQAVNPQFGKTCVRCTLDDLRACARGNPLNRIFTDQSSEQWHAMRTLFTDRILERGIEVVVPSPSVAGTLRDLDPRLAQASIRVIAHGIDFDAPKLAHPVRDATQPLRIAVLGRLSIHKGTELLRAAGPELGKLAEVTLVGCGKAGVELAEAHGWKAIERFEPADLPQLMASLAPHAGLLPSVVPETFSYALTELWAMGLPPIASNLGSFRDRIVEGQTGFLFEPVPEGLVQAVRRLREQPELLAGVAQAISRPSPGRTTADMVRDYGAILPADPRPIARFRVGIGRQTALTEPYRHLSEAYAQLNAAYVQATSAYEQTRQAYEGNRAELDSLRATWDLWLAEFNALRASRRWWNLPKALQLVKDLPRRIRSSGNPNAGK